jgi:CHAT domain-containing protein
VLYDDYVGLLLSEGRSEEALAVADHNRARTLVEGLGQLRQKTTILPPRLDAQRIAGLARGVVLYYWLGEKESFLWAITANQTKVFHLPRAAEIDASVTRYRRALEGPEDVVHHFNSDGVELYRTLVQPAQRMFEKHTKIVVLPDGSLNALNFETLVVPGPEPHFWIEDVTLSRAPSLRLLGASLRRRSPAPGKLLIMGNPLSPSPEYSTPPQAALEIEDVKGHFPVRDQMILEKDRATPNAYAASHPEQFSYIHFVAHGIANHATPLDSAIILSRETGDNDSFRLYARDIIRHPLRAEIVSISACYGAGSRAYSGEGLVGLAWAFLQAGARNVVAALWDVSGASSPQLMNDMYAGITSGRPPDEALRQAKLSLLHSGTTFAKPFYWAPFLLYTGS